MKRLSFSLSLLTLLSLNGYRQIHLNSQRFTHVTVQHDDSYIANSQTLTAITHVNIVDVKNEKIISDKTEK